MNEQDSIGMRVNAILLEAQRLATSALPFVIGYVVLLGGIATAIDLFAMNEGGDFLVNILSLVLGFVLTSQVLIRSGQCPDGLRNGFGTYFGISLLSGLAIFVGLLLVVLPGLLLLIRWAPAFGYGLAKAESSTDALGQAWRATGPHWLPIAIALSIPSAIFALGIGIYFFAIDDLGIANTAGAAAGNFLLFAGSAAGALIGLAVYCLTSGDDTELSAVFT